MDTINVIKNAKNKAAALAFANYCVSPEAQKAFSEITYYGPTNTKAAVSENVLKRSIANPELQQRIIPVDWNFVSPLRDQWTQRWRREIIANSRR